MLICNTYMWIAVLFGGFRKLNRIHSITIRGLITYGLLRVMVMQMTFEKFMSGPLRIFPHHRFGVYSEISVILLSVKSKLWQDSVNLVKCFKKSTVFGSLLMVSYCPLSVWSKMSALPQMFAYHSRTMWLLSHAAASTDCGICGQPNSESSRRDA